MRIGRNRRYPPQPRIGSDAYRIYPVPVEQSIEALHAGIHDGYGYAGRKCAACKPETGVCDGILQIGGA
jgi:hypothetical protein